MTNEDEVRDSYLAKTRTVIDSPGELVDWGRAQIKELIKLRDATHPDKGQESAVGKDLAAFGALMAAGILVQATAQWAIDHQIGLATEELKFVPVGIPQMRPLPGFQDAKKRVDSHEHEKLGVDFHKGYIKSLTIDEKRRVAIAMLRANTGGFPAGIANELAEAIEALAYGEVLPILEPVKEGRQAKFVEMREQLRAVCIYYFRKQSKMVSGFDALEGVAEAYGAKPDTLRTWEKRLKKAFGDLDVSQQIGFAKNCGSQIADVRKGEPKYAAHMFKEDMHHGIHALERSVNRYQAAKSRS